MIRDYILHDRGNSIFLGDSFANLPSPVGEGQTIKNLFKFNEDDEDKKLERDRDREKNEIKIEGKPEKQKKDTSKAGPTKENDINMKEIEEIDRIVFETTEVKLPASTRRLIKELPLLQTENDPYQDLRATNILSESIKQASMYQEEDSYINPANVSKVNTSHDIVPH